MRNKRMGTIYQNRWPHMVITGSTEDSRQMLHSNVASLLFSEEEAEEVVEVVEEEVEEEEVEEGEEEVECVASEEDCDVEWCSVPCFCSPPESMLWGLSWS